VDSWCLLLKIKTVKKMKKIVFITILIVSTQLLKAQNEFDVLRYSSLDHYGDARF